MPGAVTQLCTQHARSIGTGKHRRESTWCVLVVVVVVVVCAVLVLCVLYFFDMDSVVRVLSRTLACSMYWAWLKTLLNALPNALFSALLNTVLHDRSCGYSWDTLLDALLIYSLTTLSPILLIVLVNTLDYALLNALL